jgi:hypothetical protein
MTDFRTVQLLAYAASILVICQLLAVVGAAQDAAPIDPRLQKALDHYHQTLGEAQNYTYTERYQDINYDSKGKETLNYTDTYEVIFLEGAPYKKHTLHNDQPLPEKQQEEEEKKLADVAAARREGKDKEKKGLLSASFHFELPLDQLSTRFNTVSQPEEDLGGRKNLVFLATPPPDTLANKQAARDGLAYEMKFWVDGSDGVFARIEAKVMAEGMRYEKDSVVTYEWRKLNGEAWLPAGGKFKGKVRYMMHDVPAESVYTFSDYKKFHADTKILAQ